MGIILTSSTDLVTAELALAEAEAGALRTSERQPALDSDSEPLYSTATGAPINAVARYADSGERDGTRCCEYVANK